LKKIIVSFLLTTALLVGGSYYFLHGIWPLQANSIQQTTEFKLKKGVSLKKLSSELKESGIIDNQHLFYYYVRIFSDYSKFQAGNYQFKESTSNTDIIKKMIAGDTFEEVLFEINFPEGQAIERSLSKLTKLNLVQNKQELKLALKDKELIERYNIKSPSLEGYIYPATYRFYKPSTIKDVLQKGVAEFFKRTKNKYQKQLAISGLTMNKWVVFASLIEAETQIENEYQKVAEVIWNRLKKKDYLGIDAALIYGIKDYNGDIKWSHLKDKKNPYNTRVHKGLPPTAIASPSLNALEAVFNPTSQGYYFYVTKTDGTKEHHFSKTLKEHNRWVRELVKSSK